MQGIRPRLVFYGDDFTGATDTLATLAQGGQKTLLFLKVPDERRLAALGPLDCVGVAGAARSMAATEQQAELESVGAFLASLRAPVTHYKVCSTFDSSTDVGSIGRAVSVLRDRVRASFVPFVGGQPNLGRYCVFGNLFAAFQTGGSVFRLDRHPTMSHHPVTPMAEADLRLHLASQGLQHMAGVTYLNYDLPADELDALVDRRAREASDGVLFDVGHTSHLSIIGRIIWKRACHQPLLAVGASSVAQAVLAHWHNNSASHATRVDSAVVPHTVGTTVHTPGRADGPVFVLSGSMSPVTAKQIDAAVSYERIALNVSALMDPDPHDRETLIARIVHRLTQGRHVLAYMVAGPADAVDPALTPRTLARACGDILSRVVERARPRRIGVAGGDTASHSMQAMDVWGLSYIGQVDPGAPLCRAHADQNALSGLEIMLKGGQMGSEQVFERLLAP